MTILRADLVAAYPEFASTTTYPDAQVTFWINQAILRVSPSLFGTSYDYACILFVAHNIALSAQSAAALARGGSVQRGILTNKSIDKVSATYDIKLTSVPGGGPWNETLYGQRYYKLLQGFAAGPIYRLPLGSTGLYSGQRRF